MPKPPDEKTDKRLKNLGIDVTPELAAIRQALQDLKAKVQSIEEDSYYRSSMVSAVDLLTAAADMLESSSQLADVQEARKAVRLTVKSVREEGLRRRS